MNAVIEKIQHPKDLRKLCAVKDLPLLAKDMRDYLIETLSKIEHAHFSSNLGVVELTLALHYSFNTPEDLFFWDTGHQGYVHKMLTGRHSDLKRIRTKGSVSGFLDRKESLFDVWGAGHAGTALSAAVGAAVASKLGGLEKQHVAIIGDASLATGMTFEALNHLSEHPDLNLTIVINDNACSIDATVGGLSKHLQKLTQNTESSTIFSHLNLDYQGPIDGHDTEALVTAFSQIKNRKGVHVLHVITQKGKGYEPAELGNAAHWHAPGLFSAHEKSAQFTPKKLRYQDVFAQALIDLAKGNDKIVAVSAGMLTGTSLIQFHEAFPDRCFDVGIAEQHAVTFSAGLATQGLLPFCAIYSTFLQRGFDQVIHDVALQNLPVVFCVDRAGLVGHDGATHQGIFDLSFLRLIPNLMIASPSTAQQLKNLLYTAQLELKTPLVIRYPRGSADIESLSADYQKMTFGKGTKIKDGETVALLSLGTITKEAEKAVLLLAAEGYNVALYDLIFAKPLDANLLHEVAQGYEKIITIEEAVLAGGFGSSVGDYLLDHNYKNSLLRIGLPDQFVEHGSQDEQRAQFGLDAEGIATRVKAFSKI